MKKIIIVFALALLLGIWQSQNILNIFLAFLPEGVKLTAFSPFEAFNTLAIIVLGFAVILTMPLITFEITKYVFPALTKKEKQFAKKWLVIAAILFFIGTTFGLITIVKFGLTWFAALNNDYGLQNIWGISDFVNMIIFSSIAAGLAFEFPVILIIANRFGLIQPSALTKSRTTVFVAILIFAAWITPSVDAFSMLLIALPLYFLFESTIFYLNSKQKEVITI